MYELIIVGGGPAASSAAVYAGRKRVKTLLITESFGGQSIVSDEIENWIGSKVISGVDLAKGLEEHVRAQETVEVVTFDKVVKVEKVNGGPPEGHFIITTEAGKTFESKTILLTSGSRRRRLGILGEDEFDGKGLVFCSTCDAPLFKDKDAMVIGGGNSALEAVVDLIPYAKKIYLLVRKDVMRGDELTQEKIKGNDKVGIIFKGVAKEVLGDKFVTGLKYEDLETNEEKELSVQGVFVEIGSIPNSDFVKDIVELNKGNEVIVDHKTQSSSQVGIWAAGDVSDVLYKQNNISAGDAVKALLNIYEFLHKNNLTGVHK